jgi:hypothetical protein
MMPGGAAPALLPGDYLVAALSMDDYVAVIRDPSRFEAVARIATKITLEKGDTRALALRLVALPDK